VRRPRAHIQNVIIVPVHQLSGRCPFYRYNKFYLPAIGALPLLFSTPFPFRGRVGDGVEERKHSSLRSSVPGLSQSLCTANSFGEKTPRAHPKRYHSFCSPTIGALPLYLLLIVFYQLSGLCPSCSLLPSPSGRRVGDEGEERKHRKRKQTP
jgi:hypothetical protein